MASSEKTSRAVLLLSATHLLTVMRDFTVEQEPDLQNFYEAHYLYSGKIKGIVQDLETPDCESASN
jgi:hypothetical protein